MELRGANSLGLRNNFPGANTTGAFGITAFSAREIPRICVLLALPGSDLGNYPSVVPILLMAAPLPIRAAG